MHGGTLEPERVLQVDQAHALLPAVAEAGEDADGAIERLHAHQVTFRLSNSRLIFEVCDSPVCESSSRAPTGATIVRRPITSLSRRSKILLHGGAVRGKLGHLDHHGELFAAAFAEALDHAEELAVGAARPPPPRRRSPR